MRLWFLAILPPEEIRDEITIFKKYAADHLSSFKALRSPPHITLFPPFRLEETSIKELKIGLSNFSNSIPSFNIGLSGFGCFSPKVIFIKVNSDPYVFKLQENLKEFLEHQFGIPYSYAGFAYHPHLTVAFKDLSPANFRKGWNYFSSLEYQRNFTAGSICLLRHNDKVWEINEEFVFG